MGLLPAAAAVQRNRHIYSLHEQQGIKIWKTHDPYPPEGAG
jgi:hypothetical protein